MSKILYPVGTEVAFKSKDKPRRYKVEAYIRGSDTPYQLVGVKDSDIEKRASVDELCRFENHRYSVNKRKTGVNSHPGTASEAKSPASQKCVDLDEVKQIVKEAVAEALSKVDENVALLHDHMIDDADAIAREVISEALDQPIDEDK